MSPRGRVWARAWRAPPRGGSTAGATVRWGWKEGHGAGHPPTSRSRPPRRLLELLSERKVKRIVLLSDGRTAIVEVPVENTETNFNTMRYNRRLDFK